MDTITFIDSVDMSRPMHGDGCATVVASAIRVLGNRLILVGTSSDEVANPVGHWSRTRLFGQECSFFPVMSARELDRKYVKNFSFALRVMRFWKSIVERPGGTVMTQNYAVMWWLAFSRAFDSRVFYFPGLANQILIGRKPFLGRLLARIFEKVQFSRLRKMDLLLAAASAEEIERFTRDRSTELQNRKIFQLPTAVDTEFFAPVENPVELRRDYELQGDAVYFVCVGRLAKVKGIDLLIDALKIFIESYGPATLIVVGDGEEASSLRRHAGEAGLQNNVIFRGSVPPGQVRDLVNCADVCLVGSHTEGFSCAMVEQIACGKPLVSTNVSGAQEIIRDGENGYIVDSRNPQLFAEAMVKALKLQDAAAKSRQAALEKYSEQAVWSTFISLLEPDGTAKKPPA